MQHHEHSDGHTNRDGKPYSHSHSNDDCNDNINQLRFDSHRNGLSKNDHYDNSHPNDLIRNQATHT